MKIHFVADDKHPKGGVAVIKLKEHYGQAPLKGADFIVVLGGDGMMLHSLHDLHMAHVPVYGMNLGNVGFLMNTYHPDGLVERLKRAVPFRIYPLLMDVMTTDGRAVAAHAFNEVSLMRQTHQAAKIRLWIDGIMRMGEVISDGLLVSTPMGSTAYNFSNNGPILPIDAKLLALTPISPFRPRSWRGALLNHKADIVLEIILPEIRGVSAVADFIEVRNAARVHIKEDRTKSVTLLFDPEHDLSERILREQFLS